MVPAKDAQESLEERFPLDDLTPAMRDLITALLLYKSAFVSDWFRAIIRDGNEEAREALEAIARETLGQADRTSHLIHAWNAFPEQEQVREVVADIRKRILEDLLNLKERSTEVFVSAGIRAPTQDLRDDFLNLADLDRQHADALREILGVQRLASDARGRTGHGPLIRGVYTGPFEVGTLTRTISHALAELRGKGYEASRIIMSAVTYRHLRDEGAAHLEDSMFEGVPVDVEFAWEGECFTITTRDRVSLAEIVTSMHGKTDEGSD